MSDNLVTDKDQEVFSQIAVIADELRLNAVRNATFKALDWYSERLNVLTGAFMYLSTRFAQTKVIRENNELAKYIQVKSESTVTGEKFTSAVGEREARHAVAQFVAAEQIFESYKEAAEQGILTIKKLVEVQILERQQEVR